MTKQSVSVIKAQTASIIKVNGNKQITPPKDRALRDNVADSFANLKDGGYVFEALVGYGTLLSISDPKAFTHRQYVDDAIAAAIGGVDLSGLMPKSAGVGNPFTGDVYLGTHAIFDGTNPILSEHFLFSGDGSLIVDFSDRAQGLGVQNDSGYITFLKGLASDGNYTSLFQGRNGTVAYLDDIISLAYTPLDAAGSIVWTGDQDVGGYSLNNVGDIYLGGRLKNGNNFIDISSGLDFESNDGADKSLQLLGDLGSARFTFNASDASGLGANTSIGIDAVLGVILNTAGNEAYLRTDNVNPGDTYQLPVGGGTLVTSTIADATYLKLTGGTLTGVLTLNADASSALQPVTFQQAVAMLSGYEQLQKDYDVSTNTYPVASDTSPVVASIKKGMSWYVKTGTTGTLNSKTLVAGDEIIALVDSPGQTNANWLLISHAIGYAPISNVLNSGKILVGNASNVATDVNLTLSGTAGSFALSNMGVLTMPDAATATRGLLNSTDWNTFNGKQAALGFTPENVANKATTFGTVNNTLYPTVQAVNDRVTLNEVFTMKTSLTSTQILALNTTPQQLVPAPGAGKVLVILDVYFKLTFNTTAYTTNVSLNFRYGAAPLNHSSNSLILTSTATRGGRPNLAAFTAAVSAQVLENAAFMAFVSTANPAAGDSPMDFYVTYKIVSV